MAKAIQYKVVIIWKEKQIEGMYAEADNSRGGKKYNYHTKEIGGWSDKRLDTDSSVMRFIKHYDDYYYKEIFQNRDVLGYAICLYELVQKDYYVYESRKKIYKAFFNDDIYTYKHKNNVKELFPYRTLY